MYVFGVLYRCSFLSRPEGLAKEGATDSLNRHRYPVDRGPIIWRRRLRELFASRWRPIGAAVCAAAVIGLIVEARGLWFPEGRTNPKEIGVIFYEPDESPAPPSWKERYLRICGISADKRYACYRYWREKGPCFYDIQARRIVAKLQRNESPLEGGFYNRWTADRLVVIRREEVLSIWDRLPRRITQTVRKFTKRSDRKTYCYSFYVIDLNARRGRYLTSIDFGWPDHIQWSDDLSRFARPADRGSMGASSVLISYRASRKQRTISRSQLQLPEGWTVRPCAWLPDNRTLAVWADEPVELPCWYFNYYGGRDKHLMLVDTEQGNLLRTCPLTERFEGMRRAGHLDEGGYDDGNYWRFEEEMVVRAGGALQFTAEYCRISGNEESMSPEYHGRWELDFETGLLRAVPTLKEELKSLWEDRYQ